MNTGNLHKLKRTLCFAAIAWALSIGYVQAQILDALSSGGDAEATKWAYTHKQTRYTSIQGLHEFQFVGGVFHLRNNRDVAYAIHLPSANQVCALVSEFPFEPNKGQPLQTPAQIAESFAEHLTNLQTATGEYASLSIRAASARVASAGSNVSAPVPESELKQSRASISKATQALSKLLSQKNVFLYRWNREQVTSGALSLASGAVSMKEESQSGVSGYLLAFGKRIVSLMAADLPKLANISGNEDSDIRVVTRIAQAQSVAFYEESINKNLAQLGVDLEAIYKNLTPQQDKAAVDLLRSDLQAVRASISLSAAQGFIEPAPSKVMAQTPFKVGTENTNYITLEAVAVQLSDFNGLGNHMRLDNVASACK